jgi:WD40 repeat protein
MRNELKHQKQVGFRLLAATSVAVTLAAISIGFALYAESDRKLARNSESEAKQALDESTKVALRANQAAAKAEKQARIAESRRRAALSDLARTERLDLALLLALEAVAEETPEARSSLQRALEDRPEVSCFLDVPEGGVTGVAFGPGGILAAEYASDRGAGVVLFDGNGERLRAKPMEFNEGFVVHEPCATSALAFGPGGILAVGYDRGGRDGGGVLLFDRTGERLRPAPLEVNEGCVRAVAFGPAGTIAAGYFHVTSARGGSVPWVRGSVLLDEMGDGGVALFDGKGQRVRRAPLEVKEGGVNSVAFGPEGQIAAGYNRGHDGGVVVFDPNGARLPSRPMEVKGGIVNSVAFGPGGTLAVGYDRGAHDGGGGVVVFDPKEERLQMPVEVKEGRVTSVAFGPEGTIATGYLRADGIAGVLLLDGNGQRLRPTPLEVKEGRVHSVALGPAGMIAAVYDRGPGDGGGVVLFDTKKSQRLRTRSLAVNEGGVTSVAFGPSGVIAAGYGRNVPIGLSGMITEQVDAIRFGSVVLFDGKGERLRPGPPILCIGGVNSLAFGPGGTLAVGYNPGFLPAGVVLFDSKTRRPRAKPLEVKEGRIESLAFGPGDALAVGAGPSLFFGASAVARFDGKGEPLGTTPIEVEEGPVNYVAFGPYGAIAAGYVGPAGGGGVVLFDGQGKRVRPAPMEVMEGIVCGVAFGRGARIAVAYNRGDGGGVVLFDAKGARVRPAPMEVKEGRVSSLVYSRGGVIAAGYDRGLRRRGGVVLFDVFGERLLPAPLVVEEGGVSSVAFGPNNIMAVGHRGGGVALFDADPVSWRRTAKLIANRNFTYREWTRYFPDRPYGRVIRSRPWPNDIPDAARKQAELTEKNHPLPKGA